MVFDGRPETRGYEMIQDVVFSPDSSQYAYKALIAKKGMHEKWCVVRNGTPEAVYDRIFDLQFSRDSKYFAYTAYKDKKFIMVLNGKQIAENTQMGLPVFSPDAKKLVYAFTKNDDWFLSVNGEKTPPYDAFSRFYFSLDSSKFAYFAKDNEKWFCVINDKKGPDFTRGAGTFKFSYDSSRYAYGAIEENGARIVSDGELSPVYPSVGEPYFSPDSRYLVYRALNEKSKLWQTILNGKLVPGEYAGISEYIFSPDSNHLIFHGINSIETTRLVVDGIEQTPTFKFKIHGDPYFSPDSKHIAYYVREAEEKWRIVIDNKVLPETFGGFVRGTALLFDGPDRFHTIAITNSGTAFSLIEAFIPETFSITSSIADMLKNASNIH